MNGALKYVALMFAMASLVVGSYIALRISITRNEGRIETIEKLEEEKWAAVRRDLERIECKIDRLGTSLDVLRSDKHAARNEY